jgi:hypothetical protein
MLLVRHGAERLGAGLHGTSFGNGIGHVRLLQICCDGI